MSALSLEAAVRIVNAREYEFVVAGWTTTPAEKAAMEVVQDAAWLWHKFELAYPEEAAVFRAGIEVSNELRPK